MKKILFILLLFPFFAIAQKSTPTLVNYTSGTSVNAITPTFPTSHAAGDLAILVIETSSTQSVPTTTGWNVLGYQEVQVSGINGVRLTVYWRWCTSSSETSVSMGDSGDHNFWGMIALRGVNSIGNPMNVNVYGTQSTASTSLSVTNPTTKIGNALIVNLIGRNSDAASGQLDSWANTSLTSVTERLDAGSASSEGGGYGVCTGIKASAGSINNTTVTMLSSDVYVWYSIALYPETYWGNMGGVDARTLSAIGGVSVDNLNSINSLNKN